MMRLFKRLIWESKELQFILVTGLCLVQQFAESLRTAGPDDKYGKMIRSEKVKSGRHDKEERHGQFRNYKLRDSMEAAGEPITPALDAQ